MYTRILLLCLPLALLACKDESQGTAESTPSPPAATSGPATEPADDGFPSQTYRDLRGTSPKEPIPGCERIWAADLDGDEADEVLCSSSNELIVYGADQALFREQLRLTGSGLTNATWHGDRDNDGKDEFVVAFGMGRGFASAPILVMEIDTEGESWLVRTLYESKGERPQVTSVWGPRVYLSHFVSKYEVTGGFVQPDGSLADERRIQMGLQRVLADLDGDGQDELAVGRVYGDEPKSDGDLAVYDGNVTQTVQTLRGVRVLTAADLDGDRQSELVFGDGWHFRYGDEAKGRLNIASFTGGGYETELIHELPDQFSVMKIEVDDVDGDGRPEILAGGNDALYLYRREGAGWIPTMLGACQMGEFAAVHRADGSVRVALAGAPVGWIEPAL